MECGLVRETRVEAGGGLLSKAGWSRNRDRERSQSLSSACFFFGNVAAITAWARLM